MRNILIFFILITLSCCKAGGSLFGTRPPHEAYGDRLKSAGLDETALGKIWFTQAQLALSQPRTVALPYREKGYFAGGDPRAVGIRFTVVRGQKIIIGITRSGAATLYTELYDAETPSKLLESLDTSQHTLEYSVKKDGQLLLRLQPELLSSVSYDLKISVGPSLSFPVAGKTTSIGSFWGDARDAGARRHEGIDIFAAKRTPAVSAAYGRVTSVGENALGGKVVFLRPDDADYTLYYAHLDEQLVQDGQRVKTGDTIGLVGNTGNARTTPAHLHFGIYAQGGAIDPLPFVDREVKPAPALPDLALAPGDNARLARAFSMATATGQTKVLPAQTFFKIDAVVNTGYVARLPDGSIVSVLAANAQSASGRKVSVNDSTFLFDHPSLKANLKATLYSQQVKLYGSFGEYVFVASETDSGWIKKDRVR